MKFENHRLKLVLAALLLAAVATGRAQTQHTFTVDNGAYPWYDRTAGDMAWTLESVPESLKGSGPLAQQNCANRTLEISGHPASVTLGVFEGDVAKLVVMQPKAVATGEGIEVANPRKVRLKYRVYTLASPPAFIVGEGFAGGMLLLKSGEAKAATGPSVTAPAAKAPVGNTTASGASTPRPEKPLPATGAAAARPDVPSSLPVIPANALPSREKLHVYLLMGQSNMVGRDKSLVASQVDDSRIIALSTTGDWVAAREPMQIGGSGIGPGISFALEMLKTDPTITIGLVPCAVGATPLSRWGKGADLYEQAVKRAKIAVRAGTLKGVLWHQGEQDSLDKANADSYGIRLAFMFANLQSDLEVTHLPIVAGQLGDFLLPAKLPYAGTVRAAIAHVAEVLPDVGYADAVGLGDMGDSLHFSAKAQNEFGGRYAVAMLQLQQRLKVAVKTPVVKTDGETS